MSFVPGLAADLKNLEKGILMYSYVYDKIVIAKAPVMFITADNPAHSDICGLRQQTTLYNCRKCYCLKQYKQKGKTLAESGVTVDKLNKDYQPRTTNHYIISASNANRKEVNIEGVLEFLMSAYNLSFKNTGSDDLLQLTSYDPSLDTPVEALHCILLGIGKYLIQHLLKVIFAGKANEQMRHVGSFLGRDFKQLMQVLTGIIADEFTDPVVDKKLLLLNESLTVLGKLCSLAFVREVEGDFDEYVGAIKTTVEELTVKMFGFDIATNNATPFSTRPKVHYLHHLHEDICRFGCALYFETEKGEMFNKFIREQLFHTNRHHPSRDIATRFSKQEVLKHFVDGGSWLNSKNERVKYGSAIEAFIRSDEVSLRQQFFGACEFAENNCTPMNKKLVLDFKGVFKTSGNNDYDRNSTAYSFVGVVLDHERVEEYEVLSKDTHGRLQCQETGKVHQMDNLLPTGVLDMSQTTSLLVNSAATTESTRNKTCYNLNLSKFGTITLYLINFIIQSDPTKNNFKITILGNFGPAEK